LFNDTAALHLNRFLHIISTIDGVLTAPFVIFILQRGNIVFPVRQPAWSLSGIQLIYGLSHAKETGKRTGLSTRRISILVKDRFLEQN